MTARTRHIVLASVGLLTLAGASLLLVQRAGAAPADIGDCFQLDAAGCASSVGGAAGKLGGVASGVQTALGGPEEWLKSIVESAGEAIELAFGLVQTFLSNQADPQLVAPWFAEGPYAAATRVAAMLATLAAFMEIVRATVKGELGGLAGRIMLGLPAIAIAIGVAPTVLQTVVSFVDSISSGIIGASQADLRGFSDSILARTGDGASGIGGALIVLLVQIVLIFSLLATALALLLRQVAAYLLVVMIPISAMGVVFEPVRKFATRTVEVFFAIIFSKIVIALALSIGAAALASAVSAPSGPPPAAKPPAASSSTTAPAKQQEGIALIMTGLAGIVTYGAAAFAPIGLLMLVPSAEAAAMSMRGVRQMGGEARQSAGAVSGVDRAKGTAKQATTMAVSAGVSTAVAGATSGGGAGGRGAVGSGGGGAAGGGGGPGNGAAGLPPGGQSSGSGSGAPMVGGPGGGAPPPSGPPGGGPGSRPGGSEAPPPSGSLPSGDAPGEPSGDSDGDRPSPAPESSATESTGEPAPPSRASAGSGSSPDQPSSDPGAPATDPPPPSRPSPGAAYDPSDRTTGDPR
jgi:hypothetical protein